MSSICNTTNHRLEIPDMAREIKYMDLESGVWCASLGHGNSRIVKVLTEQAGTLMHAGFCYSNRILEEAVASVLSITGFDGGKCVFLCSGSEVIELTRQTARHLTGKKISMTLHDTYLGSYSSLKEREKEWYLFNWEECAACPRKEEFYPGCRQRDRKRISRECCRTGRTDGDRAGGGGVHIYAVPSERSPGGGDSP